jgi:hypothetical protein
VRTSVFLYNTLYTIKNEGGTIYKNGIYISGLLDFWTFRISSGILEIRKHKKFSNGLFSLGGGDA